MEGLLQEQVSLGEKLYSRKIVSLSVVHVSDGYVLVDIGEKKEGIIPVSDFQDERGIPEAGSKVTAVFEKRGGENNHVLLSHRRAREITAWEECRKAFEEKTRVGGIIAERIKGGYIVDMSGIEGFMPLSHSESCRAYKHLLPVKARIKCYIIEMSKDKKRLIVSRKQVLEEDEKIRRGKILERIRSGDIVQVVVSNVNDLGIHLRFRGIGGFIRFVDVAWRDPGSAIKTYERGRRVKVRILSIDEKNGKIDFGIKQLTPNPADVIKKRFPQKSVVKAGVVSVDSDGMKVTVGKPSAARDGLGGAVEGFVPACEFGQNGPAAAGETISAVVTGVNQSNFSLSLSVKRYEVKQDRKRVQQYLKGAPPLTLGQLLSGDSENEGAGQT